MNGRTPTDTNGHVRRDERTDTHSLKNVSVRCPVRRLSRKQIHDIRSALGAMFGQTRIDRDRGSTLPSKARGDRWKTAH